MKSILRTLGSILLVTTLLGFGQLAFAGPVVVIGPSVGWHKADQNHDGRVSWAERQRARFLRRNSDLNGDGKLGPRERRLAWKRL